MRQRTGKGFTLVELLVVIVIIGVLAGILLPAIIRAIERARVVTCANNLSQLWKTQCLSMSQNRGFLPIEQGGAFWLMLSRMTPPLVDEPALYVCPFDGEPPAAGTTDYRGPSGNVNLYGRADVVGADRMGNHRANEGGNVLKKSGAVLEVEADDLLWIQASTKTRD